ncbi:hypothetical protein [Microcoleus sp. FACHB-831]
MAILNVWAIGPKARTGKNLLLDVGLPGVGGVEACRLLKQE